MNPKIFASHGHFYIDGEPLAGPYLSRELAIADWPRVQRNRRRRERDQAMRDCGLVRVRGALGGIYWE